MIKKAFHEEAPPFTVEGYHVSMRRDGPVSVCQATIKVQVGDEIEHTVAEGDGPVNALDAAMRLALARFFPKLKKVQLIDYKVRIIDSTVGTAAKTRVFIQSTDGHREWSTVGADDNIVEASLQALIDSMEYVLMKNFQVKI